MDYCLLCLELSNESLDGIKVNSTQWQELNIGNVVEKHLWPMQTIQQAYWLCKTCWQELNGFHEFYIRIEEAHTNFGLCTKIENGYIEDLYETEISLKGNVFIKQDEELVVNVKQEYKQDLEEDNNTLVTTTKRKQIENLNPTGYKCKKLKQEKTANSITHKSEIPTDELSDIQPPQTKKVKIHKSQHINEKKDKFLLENFKLECVICQIPMETFQLLCKHFETDHEGKPAYVMCCNTKFHERRLILDHVHQHVDRNYLKCKKCKKVFQNLQYLRRHIKRQHGTSTNTIQTADSDNDSHNTNSDDDIPTNTIESSSLNRDAFLAKHFKLECVICHLPMETFFALCEHFEKEHDGQPGYAMCCESKFFERRLILDHVNQHLDPNYLKCKDCNKVFTNRRYLTVHSSIHDPKRSRNFCCDICGLNFATQYSLICHQQAKHISEEDKIFPCTHCDKKFASKCLLTGHVRSVHKSPINCDLCGITVVNKHALRRHKYNKHSEGEKIEYTCPICSKISTNLYTHQSHVKKVHQMGYDYKCTICDRGFKKERALKEHIATHTGSPLYMCPWCPKTFNSHSNIAKHRKKYHPDEEEDRKKNSGIYYIKTGD